MINMLSEKIRFVFTCNLCATTFIRLTPAELDSKVNTHLDTHTKDELKQSIVQWSLKSYFPLPKSD